MSIYARRSCYRPVWPKVGHQILDGNELIFVCVARLVALELIPVVDNLGCAWEKPLSDKSSTIWEILCKKLAPGPVVAQLTRVELVAVSLLCARLPAATGATKRSTTLCHWSGSGCVVASLEEHTWEGCTIALSHRGWHPPLVSVPLSGSKNDCGSRLLP